MKAPPFDYHLPATQDQALSLLSSVENAKVLAGGQSLVAMLNLRYVFPSALIDINALPDLSEITFTGDVCRIGAMTRQRAMEISLDLAERAPIFREALGFVGHRQTRNRGTIAGSLCHLDPSAELPTLALLFDAIVHVASTCGRRVVDMKDFVVGYLTTDLGANELVTGLEFPVWPRGHGYAFIEYARRHGDFAIASAACLMEVSAEGDIRRAAVCVGGVGEVPMRIAAAEAMLVGQSRDTRLFQAAADLCLDLPALGDIHAGVDYRRHVAATLVRRALAKAYDRAQGGANFS